MPVRDWKVHLPAGVSAEELDLGARVSLPAAWVAVWARDPTAPTLFDQRHGWITAAELENATRRAAGRLQAAGLEPGDRMLFSAESSLELVIAHIAALRSGIVVVPIEYRLPGARGRAHRRAMPVPERRSSTIRTVRAGFAPPPERTRWWSSGPRSICPTATGIRARCGDARRSRH